MIFISPNLPLNEQNQVMNPNDLSVQVIQNLEQHAPPMYGEHQFDQLYSNVDPSGFVTPGGASGINTPFNLHSRNASMEDVSMNNTAEAEISANVLQNRLYNIQDHGSSRHARDRSATVVPGSLPGEPTDEESSVRHNSVPHIDTSSNSAGSTHRPSPSHPLSRRTSDDDATPTAPPQTLRPEAQHIEMNDMNEIFRLPSYGRAVRTPVRTSANEGPPTYQAAVTSSSALPHPPPSAPVQAHTAGPTSYFRDSRTLVWTRGSPASSRS